MKKYLPFILLSVAQISGCASIIGSKNQPVSINTVCDAVPVTGASCTMINGNGTWYVQTPGSVTIQKAYSDLAIDCKLGQSKGSNVFESSSNGAVWGNILFGGLIGLAVDANSGAGFDYPSTMLVSLNQPCSAK